MAKKRDLRKLVGVQDIGDILALVSSVRELLAYRTRQIEHKGQRTANRLGREGSQMLATVAVLGNRLSSLIERKRRELARTSQDTVEHIQKEVAHTAQTVERTVDKTVKEVDKTVKEKVLRQETHQQDQGETGVFVVGAILGTLIGAVVAIWFAPQSGKETREDLEQIAAETRQRIEGESLDDAIQAGKAEARKFQETANIR